MREKSSKSNEDNKDDSATLDITKIIEPNMVQVVVHNDDYTPMEFVVRILETFFYMDRVKATDVMLQAHQLGQAICGIFTRDVAETKVLQVIDYAERYEHPLVCSTDAVL